MQYNLTKKEKCNERFIVLIFKNEIFFPKETNFEVKL